jgi:mono/diheme cytochrome c family protein
MGASFALVLFAALAVSLCLVSNAQQIPPAAAPQQQPFPPQQPQQQAQPVMPPQSVAQTAPEATPQDQAIMAFWNRSCFSCHGLKGHGDGPWHTLFEPEPANLTLVQDSYQMMLSIVLNGVPGTMMPAFPTLDQGTFNGILTMLQMSPRDLSAQWEYPWSTQEGPNGRDVDPKVGMTQFASFCAGCHGEDGSAQTQYAANPLMWPKPAILTARNSDAGRAFWIITNGRQGTMMPYQKDRLPELTRWALARYVTTLWNANSPATIQVPREPIQKVSNPFYSGDTQTVTTGRDQFNLWCGACHGGDAVGTFLAPRLIDRIWKYGGGTDTALWIVLAQGVPGHLMPAWSDVPEDLRWKFVTYLRYRGGLPECMATELEMRAEQPARHPQGEH